jgi:hypothetical protein
MAQDHAQGSQEPARSGFETSTAVAAAPSSSPTGPAPGVTQGAEGPRGAPADPLKGLILTAVLALAFGMIGAYAERHFLEGPPGQAGAADANANQPAGPEAEGVGPTTKDLSEKLAGLSDRVDAVTHRLDTLPKPAPPPDLSDLQVRVADLKEATEEIAPLREAIKRVDGRLDEIGQMVHSLGDELHAASSRVGTSRTTSAGNGNGIGRTTTTEDIIPAPAPEKPVKEEALERGAELFRQHKYQEALDFFSKLEQNHPDDARVWYYAALAHGFAKNQWTDDGTGRLVEKGIERERAGTPPSPVIDQTFKDLTSDTGKDWLAAYRKRVKTR